MSSIAPLAFSPVHHHCPETEARRNTLAWPHPHCSHSLTVFATDILCHFFLGLFKSNVNKRLGVVHLCKTTSKKSVLVLLSTYFFKSKRSKSVCFWGPCLIFDVVSLTTSLLFRCLLTDVFTTTTVQKTPTLPAGRIHFPQERHWQGNWNEFVQGSRVWEEICWVFPRYEDLHCSTLVPPPPYSEKITHSNILTRTHKRTWCEKMSNSNRSWGKQCGRGLVQSLTLSKLSKSGQPTGIQVPGLPQVAIHPNFLWTGFPRLSNTRGFCLTCFFSNFSI